MTNKSKKPLLIVIAMVSILVMVGCGAQTTSSGNQVTYESISAEEAKTIMDTEKEYIIIDARTQSEFEEGHIEGAILMPEYEIKERAEAELTDKEQLILVYCRSGRRSKVASQNLVDLGYTNVKEFGGIIDWEYDVVK